MVSDLRTIWSLIGDKKGCFIVTVIKVLPISWEDHISSDIYSDSHTHNLWFPYCLTQFVGKQIIFELILPFKTEIHSLMITFRIFYTNKYLLLVFWCFCHWRTWLISPSFNFFSGAYPYTRGNILIYYPYTYMFCLQFCSSGFFCFSTLISIMLELQTVQDLHFLILFVRCLYMFPNLNFFVFYRRDINSELWTNLE